VERDPLATKPIQENSSNARRWASLKQAAHYLGTTDRSVRNYVASGKFRAYRLTSRLVRVDLNEIDAAMQPFGGAA
jgi:excisionase family DNA binding protein